MSAPPRRRLLVEALEDRCLPNVAFQPFFGNETVTNGNGRVMSSPGIYLVYWGPYWQTLGGQIEAGLINNQATHLFQQSAYLSGLQQYGSNGQAAFAGSVFDFSQPPNNFSQQQLQNEVQGLINNNVLPESDNLNNLPIYAVVTQPGILSSNPAGAGFHVNVNAGGLDNDDIPMAWAKGDANPDNVLVSLSHEVAESMSDLDGNAITLTPGPNWPLGPPPGLDEIGDNEPGGTYNYRVNGALAQAYWSDQDKFYLVPDGNSQIMVLAPQWSGTTFQGSILSVYGDQSGIVNDALRIDTSLQGGVRIRLNGEVFTFEPNVITQINVNLYAGANLINVEATPKNVPVNITLGKGGNLVVLSGQAHNMSNIGGPVSVKGGAGKARIVAFDQADPTPRTATLSASSLSGLGSMTLTYGGADLDELRVFGGPLGNSYLVTDTPSSPLTLTRTFLDSGLGDDVVSVQGTSGPLHIDGDSGNDVVRISGGDTGGPATLANIRAPVHVTETGDGRTSLLVDDSGDTAAKVAVLAHGFLTGLTSPLAPISWAPHALRQMAVYGGRAGNNFTVINPGPFPTFLAGGAGNDSVNVQEVSGSLTVDGRGGADTVLVGRPVPNGRRLDRILAPVIVQNHFGQTDLTVDDSADATGRSATLTGTDLTGMAPAAIQFVAGQVTSLNIQAGQGDDTLTLAAPPPAALVSFDGGGGHNTLVGPNLPNTWLLSGPNAGFVNLVQFSSVQNLVGGSDVDVFTFINGGSVNGTIDGGGGQDWLDYGPVTSHVVVDLAAGGASAVGGGILHIRHVRAGSGGALLRGNALGNILVGGGGDDKLLGGSGRSILIGGMGKNHLAGGNADDLLIAGWTDYDANFAALQAIFDEWQSGDPFGVRVSKIKAGVGPNNAYRLVWTVTVHDNGVPDVLDGKGGLNWFFANPVQDKLLNYALLN